MSDAEMRRTDRLTRGGKTAPIEVWRVLKKSHEGTAMSAPKGQKRKASKLSKSTVYNYCTATLTPGSEWKRAARNQRLPLCAGTHELRREAREVNKRQELFRVLVVLVSTYTFSALTLKLWTEGLRFCLHSVRPGNFKESFVSSRHS